MLSLANFGFVLGFNKIENYFVNDSFNLKKKINTAISNISN